MDDEHRRLAEVNDGGYARKQEEYEQAKSRAAAARDEYEQHEQGASRLQEDVKNAKWDFESKGKIVDAKKKDITQAENRLRTLAREDGQRQSGFPDKMPQLLRAIQQEKSFTSRPIGPVGSHVTLLKPKWSSILESSFGQTLSSFIVTTKRDQNLLSSIMGRVNWYVFSLSFFFEAFVHSLGQALMTINTVIARSSLGVAAISTPQGTNQILNTIQR